MVVSDMKFKYKDLDLKLECRSLIEANLCLRLAFLSLSVSSNLQTLRVTCDHLCLEVED